MPNKTKETIQTLHPTPGKTNKRIALYKYNTIKDNLLIILTDGEPSHSELMEQLYNLLIDSFEGGIQWYGETVKLDLEARNIIKRTNTKPERYTMSKVFFKTNRLNIRPVSVNDIDLIHALHCLPEVDQYNTSGIPSNIDETKTTVNQWITAHEIELPKKYTFTIELNENMDFIGLIGLNIGKEKYRNAEVWFKFKPSYWNQGYATESLKQIIRFGFNQLNLHRIEAGCAIENIGSFKVLEKVGMLREAHTRQLLPLKSGWSDNYGYAILSTDITNMDKY
jgi:RimJ/RimL family protein N-acetyltransferase